MGDKVDEVCIDKTVGNDVSSTIDMDSFRELECSDKHCAIFLVDSTCYLLFNPVFGVTIGHRLISIEYFEKLGSRSGSDRYVVKWTKNLKGF